MENVGFNARMKIQILHAALKEIEDTPGPSTASRHTPTAYPRPPLAGSL